MNEGCILSVSFFFFSQVKSKRRKKKKKKKEESFLHEKIFAVEKEAKIKSFTKGLLCVHMKELMNPNFLHSFKEAVT